MSDPKRIQRKRTKGWRMPPSAVYVGRPTIWGNPFTGAAAVEAGFLKCPDGPEAAQFLTDCFREWLEGCGSDWWAGVESAKRRAAIKERLVDLRGKDLACWCLPYRPCHADVLLELANK